MKQASIVVVVIVLIFAIGIFISSTGVKQVKPKKEYTLLPSSTYIIQVNNDGIKNDEFQNKLDSLKTFYTSNKKQVPDEATLDKNILDGLINDLLVKQYASQKKISVGENEVQSKYEEYVAGYNKRNKLKVNDDSTFLFEIERLYGIDKAAYQAQIRMDILKERVQYDVKMPISKWLELQRSSSFIKSLNPSFPIP